jgi:hypothetical protein
MSSLSPDAVLRLRLRAQRLQPQPEPLADAARVVQELCGVQAQEVSAATLAVRPRSSGLVAADVDRARVQERSLVRTWGQRGTLHLLAAEDLGWFMPLIGPVFVAGGRRRRAELGLDDDICARGIAIIRDALASQGPLTRAELVEWLDRHGIRLIGQARPHLLSRAALEGTICFGPDRGAEPTYVLLSDWIGREHPGHTLSEAAAHAELTRRYLAAYGPATPQDQAAWSGMPLSKTRAAWGQIAGQLLEVEVAGVAAWMLKTCAAWLDEPPAPAPIVRLLPRFDTYLLGYRDRDMAVPRQHAKRINAGGGMLHPVVLVDGRAVGTWKSERKRKGLEVTLEPFEGFAPELHAGLAAEVSDVARFLHRDFGGGLEGT